MPASKAAAYAPGDIIVVPFPYTDRFAQKRRPALVVSNEIIERQGFLWVVMIASASNSPMAHDLLIADLAGTGLPSPSVVRPIKAATIEPSRVIRRAGRLDSQLAAEVFAAIRSFIGR